MHRSVRLSRRRLMAVALVAVGVVAVGAGVLYWGGLGAARRPAGTLEWTYMCPSTPVDECATLEVPLDYAHPDGPKLPLALGRLNARDPDHRIGVLLVNPGGPGVSGLEFLGGLRFFGLSTDLHEKFDIVSFDPRGIGASSPVRCEAQHHAVGSLVPRDAAGLAVFSQEARAAVAGCDAASLAELPYLGTESVARDMDAIRAALGEEKITYLGFSYGTLIGALYADLFPTHVRAMVLDGPLDPSLDYEQFTIDQSNALDAALDAALDECASNAECPFHSDGHPREALRALLATLHTGATASPSPSATIGLGDVPSNVFDWMASELYANQTDDMFQTLADAQGGDTAKLMDLGGPPVPEDFNDAVMCIDFQAPRGAEPYLALAKRAQLTAPWFGEWNAFFNFDCAFWPAPNRRVPRPVTAKGVPAIVVLAATDDPSTPYKWGTSLAHQLPGAVLVTRPGGGHTSYSAPCVGPATDAYLIRLESPDPNPCG